MSYNILIVDDSATTRAIIKRTIKLADLPTDNLFEAADGQEALDMVAANHIDLVLADLHMPRMGGVEMTRELFANQSTRDIPVVVISAEPNLDRLEQLKSQGVKAYLRKPFTPEAIRDVIAQTLGVPHA